MQLSPLTGRSPLSVTKTPPGRRSSQPKCSGASLGLADGVRCGLTFSEVAGFDAKPGRGRNQGLKGPLSIDFARTAEDGPWVITGLRGKTPLGEATVTIRAVRFEPSAAARLLALN